MQAEQSEASPTQTIAELVGQWDGQDPAESIRAVADIMLQLEPEEMALALEGLPLDKRVPVWRSIPG